MLFIVRNQENFEKEKKNVRIYIIFTAHNMIARYINILKSNLLTYITRLLIDYITAYILLVIFIYLINILVYKKYYYLIFFLTKAL